MESPHNYENSRHETTVFACPGATSFEKVTFDAGPQLQFLFHSDSSNNEWGYKFTVTALGLPDITISWMSDLQLLVARLMGRLASRTLALKSPYEIRSVKELQPGKMSHVQASPLWKPILRHGLCETRETNPTKKAPNQTDTSTFGEISAFLEDFARWNPSQEPSDHRAELMRTLVQACRKHPMSNEIVAGSKTDQAVNAIWAAMVYHTPALNQALKAYAEMCIEKSLLLIRFAPSSIKSCQGGDSSKAKEGSFGPLLRSSSISEGDFQPISSLGQCPGLPDEASDARPEQSQLSNSQPPNSSSSEHSRRGHRDSTENLSSHPPEPASPSTFPRKVPFSRSRLRLLSYRSIEESHMTPSVKERHPILKHILNFMKDQALTTARYIKVIC
ncbi:hypothetical protein GOODEAATRI_016233 [Goodea atripinnis]|uniref:Uncharacterized protein n=1 Tax=Goodea atripinnis TaxID=208336 RepID=A0ABV0MI98_9TELE